MFISFTTVTYDTCFSRIPLSAGLFNRDVYLEGLKRRATTLNSIKDNATICSVQ